MPTTSATGRLFAELDALRSLQNAGGSLLDAIGTRAAGSAADQRAAYRLLATIHDLIAQSREEIVRYPQLNQQLFSNALNHIDIIFKNNHTAGNWPSIAAELSKQLVALEFCAERLNELVSEAVLPAAEVKSLFDLSTSLVNELMASSLPEDLRALLVRRAEDIRRALQEYHLSGAQGLEAATAAAFGVLVAKKASLENYKSEASVLKYLDMLVKLDTAARAVGRWAITGADTVRKLLTLASGSPPEAS